MPLGLKIICVWLNSLANQLDEERGDSGGSCLLAAVSTTVLYEELLIGYEKATGNEMEQSMGDGSI